MTNCPIRLVAGFVLACCSLTPTLAEDAPEPPAEAPAPAPAPSYDGPPPAFLVGSSTMRTGESQMLAMRLDQAAPTTVDGTLEVTGEGGIVVVRQPQVVDGQTVGFCRIRSTKPGAVTLRSGESSLQLTITDDAPMALIKQMRPVITNPVPGAVLFGKIAVGADVWVGAPGVDRNQCPAIQLELSDGTIIKPIESFPPLDGPFWRFVFELDCDPLKPGNTTLTASYQSSLSGTRLTSDSIQVQVLASDQVTPLAGGEAENSLDTPRSDRLGKEPPGTGFNASASNNRYVTLFANRPALVIEADVPEKASYQVIATAKGTLAGSAYPSIEILEGERARGKTNGRLVSTTWRRVAIGKPFQLDKGTQLIGITLANDFSYRGRVDRNAEVDRYEIVKVPSGGNQDEAAMMMMTTMMSEGSMMGGDSMMSGGGTMNAMAPAKEPAKGGGPVHLRCAFSSVLHGESLNGETDITCMLLTDNFRKDPQYDVIDTTLLINGKAHATVSGRYPKFHLFPHDLAAGDNRLRLLSTDRQGAVAMSDEQVIVANAASHPKQPLPIGYDHDVYDLHRGGWKGIKRGDIPPGSPLAGDGAPNGVHRMAAGEKSANAVTIDIPQHIEGTHRIAALLTTWQEPAPPAPPTDPTKAAGATSPAAEPTPATVSASIPVEVVLNQPKAKSAAEKSISLGILTPGDAWQWQVACTLKLRKGPKSITLKPCPTALEDGATAIDIALGGVRLERPKFVDQAPPEIAIRYPHEGGSIASTGDVLVADVFDDTRIDHLSVRIDGKPTGPDWSSPRSTGRVVLPIDPLGIASGEHTLTLVARDKSGKESTSAPVKVVVKAPATTGTLGLPFPRAVRLARRFAFGADPQTIADILVSGEAEWLTNQLTAPHDAARDQLARAYANLHFAGVDHYRVRGKVIAHALNTDTPARARFVLWAQNHFSTWINKTGPTEKWAEHRAFDAAGVTRFNDLLLMSATSPAMMKYLDQQNSLGRQLNENYAREIMELHTVGVDGGYSQEDVTSLAHVLTGWGAQKEASPNGSQVTYQFRFSPYLTEPEEHTVFGLRIGEPASLESADDRILQVLEMLAARPETARRISGKLVEHYVGLPADETLVEQLTNVYLTTGGDMRALLMTIAADDALMQVALPDKLLQPVEFGIAAQRTTQSFHPWSVISLGDRSGRNLFDRATPDGYPEENEEYADSNFQLQKWKYCKELEHQLSSSLPWQWFDAEKLNEADHRNLIIRSLGILRNGEPLNEASSNALHQVLQQDIKDHNQRRILFGTFFMMLPEMQTR